MSIIHIVTPEYQPRIGGVADYTRILATGLAATGEQVHVWAPADPASGHAGRAADGIAVHRELGTFSSADLRRMGDLLDRFPAPRRLVVQWVPHGYGYRAMNFGFCLWLWARARRGDRVEIMVHEPFLHMTEGGLKQTAAALVHRVMTIILLRAAQRVWVSIPAWEAEWKPYTLGRAVPFGWLPIPSCLGTANPSGVSDVRQSLNAGTSGLVGHLGTYGSLVDPLLRDVLVDLLQRPNAPRIALLGINSDAFRARFVSERPQFAASIQATGAIDDDRLAAYVASCDVLVQPYPDGVSSRRTTVMAALSVGVPVVTTLGRLTESVWAESRGVRLTAVGDHAAMANDVCDLLAHADARQQLVGAGHDLYARTFDLRRTIDALTAVPVGVAA